MGHTECVKALIQAGAKAGLSNQNGYTAIMAAQHQNHQNIVSFLENKTGFLSEALLSSTSISRQRLQQVD